ncbi:hypothetical protein WR25_10038 [Diploscapter pachys]|uniref:Uncharacterized protein n=1 Tax=Diploscapter pachys TaxID=2018661 RepID=A0A2A2JAL5_9BILA|nr:hypothetical protein WR25_10038 [Diploscapter pachys]
MSSKPEERRRLAAKSEDDAEIRTVQPGIVTLNVPDDDGIVIGGSMKKSSSMASLRAKIRNNREKFRQNQCAGMILFLIVGGILNILAYFASVWSAQLNADVVKAAVENEHALKFKLKKGHHNILQTTAIRYIDEKCDGRGGHSH